jgi:hypothetical protein
MFILTAQNQSHLELWDGRFPNIRVIKILAAAEFMSIAQLFSRP